MEAPGLLAGIDWGAEEVAREAEGLPLCLVDFQEGEQSGGVGLNGTGQISLREDAQSSCHKLVKT